MFDELNEIKIIFARGHRKDTFYFISASAFFWVRSIVVLLISVYILINLFAMGSWAESFYDVKYWTSVITSNVPQKILNNENIRNKHWCFQILKIVSLKNHFGILICILSWKHLFEMYFRLLRRNNKLKINNFLKNIWRNNWRFNIWLRKRTPLLSVIILTNYIFILTFYSRLELTMVKHLGIGLAGSPAGRGTFCGIPQTKRTSLSTIVSSWPYELMKFRTMLGITILLRYFVILYLVRFLRDLKTPKFLYEINWPLKIKKF